MKESRPSPQDQPPPKCYATHLYSKSLSRSSSILPESHSLLSAANTQVLPSSQNEKCKLNIHQTGQGKLLIDDFVCNRTSSIWRPMVLRSSALNSTTMFFASVDIHFNLYLVKWAWFFSLSKGGQLFPTHSYFTPSDFLALYRFALSICVESKAVQIFKKKSDQNIDCMLVFFSV